MHAMRRRKMTDPEKIFDKNILIAVDESDNARRAVSYVGQLLGGLPGFKITVLHVIAEPEDDYFRTASQKEEWLTRHIQKIELLLKEYRQLLIREGFEPGM